MRALLALAFVAGCGGSVLEQVDRRAPEIPSTDAASWIGSPTTLAALRGNVVLVEAWHRH